MKIIEGLKQIKDLQRKASDIRAKIRECAAKMSFETSKYENQREKVAGWLQSHHDLVLEIERLRERISKTNVLTTVTIDLCDKSITKTIHSWISRRRDLSALDLSAWQQLSDMGLKDQAVRSPSTTEVVEFKVVRFFDPSLRDKKIDALKSEISIIDAKLEIVNATTDLLD